MPPASHNGGYPALRISQLDATELDNELHHVLKAQFLNAFRYLPPGLLDKVEPELNATLKAAIWALSLKAHGATVGQQMLSLKYKNIWSYVKGDWITQRQKYVYAILTIGLSWFQDRLPGFSGWIPDDSTVHLCLKMVTLCERVFKVLSLLNFLIFLCKGKYQFILERLLGIQVVYPERQLIRQVSFEYMSRELLWHGFAEFLMFILPFVNFRRIKNTLSRYIYKKPDATMKIRCPADYKQCIVCGEWPCLPQEVGCSHVFCYYCITANLKADPSFTCPGCGHETAQIQPILLTFGVKRS